VKSSAHADETNAQATTALITEFAMRRDFETGVGFGSRMARSATQGS
jgi:hypothetical protein